MKRITKEWLRSRGISEGDLHTFMCEYHGIAEIDLLTVGDLIICEEDSNWFVELLPEPHRGAIEKLQKEAWRVFGESTMNAGHEAVNAAFATARKTVDTAVIKVLEELEFEMCVCCGRPIATVEDYSNYKECEGDHLCWGCDVDELNALECLHEYILKCIDTDTMPTLEGKNAALREL